MIWIEPDEEMPDADITVLMRLKDEEFPVWPGFWDGEDWRNADASPVGCAVIGWLHLENAAMLLDGEKTAPAVQKCRVCGCTDDDCRQCIGAQGHPCWWVEEDLCSRCQAEAAEAEMISETGENK